MKYISKQFLSPHYDETGSIVVKVASTELSNMGEWSAENLSVDASVEFRDCHGKPIYLDFNIDKDRSLEDRLVKCDLIITELQQMKRKLAVACADTATASREWYAKEAAEQKASEAVL